MFGDQRNNSSIFINLIYNYHMVCAQENDIQKEICSQKKNCAHIFSRLKGYLRAR